MVAPELKPERCLRCGENGHEVRECKSVELLDEKNWVGISWQSWRSSCNSAVFD